MRKSWKNIYYYLPILPLEVILLNRAALLPADIKATGLRCGDFRLAQEQQVKSIKKEVLPAE